MGHRYAILLDVEDRRVVIIGGGSVAARKAAGLIEAGAKDVHVYAPKLDARMPEQAKWTQAEYEPGQLEGASLVFAATDQAAVNDAVLAEAAARGIFASRADSDEVAPGDFVVPARLNRGPIQIAISAGSAALSAALRDRIAESLDGRLVSMAEAMRELRPLIRDRSGLDPSTRRDVFRALASDEALEVLAKDGLSDLKAWIAGKFPQWTPH